MAESNFNLGNLFVSVGLDTSVAEQELNRFEQALSNSVERISIVLTDQLTSTISDTIKNGLEKSAQSAGETLGRGLVAGFSATLVAGLTEAINLSIQTAVQSRSSLVKNAVSGVGNSIVEGLNLYGKEYRSKERAKFVFGGGDRDKIPAGFSKEAEDKIVNLASETARTRAEISDLLFQLSKSGFGANQVVKGKDNLLRSTVQLSEAADVENMKDTAYMLSSLKSVFPQVKSSKIASGLLGLNTTSLEELQRFRFAFQDAAPVASQAGIGFSKDLMPAMSILMQQMTPEVAGTSMKNLLQPLVQPSPQSRGIISAFGKQVRKDPSNEASGLLEAFQQEGNFLQTLRSLEDYAKNLLKEGELGSLFGLGDIQTKYNKSQLSQSRDIMVNQVISKLFGSNETALKAYRSINAVPDKIVRERQRRFANFTDPDREESAIETAQKIKYEGFAGAMDQISSSIENVKVSMGKLVEPGVTQAVLTFRDIANQINDSIPSIGGALEGISQKLKTQLSPDSPIFDNIVEGIKNSLENLFGVFEGWTDRILGLFDTEEEAERIFNKFNNLITETVSAFGQLTNVMSNLLPLINDVTNNQLAKYQSEQTTNRVKRNYGKNEFITEASNSGQVWFEGNKWNPFSGDTPRPFNNQGKPLTDKDVNKIMTSENNYLLSNKLVTTPADIDGGSSPDRGLNPNNTDPKQIKKGLSKRVRKYKLNGETYVRLPLAVGGQERSYLYKIGKNGELETPDQGTHIAQELNKQGGGKLSGTSSYRNFGAGVLSGSLGAFGGEYNRATERENQLLNQILANNPSFQGLIETRDKEGQPQFKLSGDQNKINTVASNFLSTDIQGNLNNERLVQEIGRNRLNQKNYKAFQNVMRKLSPNMSGQEVIEQLERGVTDEQFKEIQRNLLTSLAEETIKNAATQENLGQIFEGASGKLGQNEANTLAQDIQENESLDNAISSNNIQVRGNPYPHELAKLATGQGGLSESGLNQLKEALEGTDMKKVQNALLLKIKRNILQAVEEVNPDDIPNTQKLLEKIIKDSLASGTALNTDYIKEQLQKIQQETVSNQTGIFQSVLQKQLQGNLDKPVQDVLLRRINQDVSGNLSQEALDKTAKKVDEKRKDISNTLVEKGDDLSASEVTRLKNIENRLTRFIEAIEAITAENKGVNFNLSEGRPGDPQPDPLEFRKKQLDLEQKLTSSKQKQISVAERLLETERKLIAERNALLGQSSQTLSRYLGIETRFQSQRNDLSFQILSNRQNAIQAQLSQSEISQGRFGSQTGELQEIQKRRVQAIEETIQKQQELRGKLPELRDEQVSNFIAKSFNDLFQKVTDSNLLGGATTKPGQIVSSIKEQYQNSVNELARIRQTFNELKAITQNENELTKKLQEEGLEVTPKSLEEKIDDLKSSVVKSLNLAIKELELVRERAFIDAKSSTISGFQQLVSQGRLGDRLDIAQRAKENTVQTIINDYKRTKIDLEEELNKFNASSGGANVYDTEGRDYNQSDFIKRRQKLKGATTIGKLIQEQGGFLQESYGQVSNSIQRLEDFAYQGTTGQRLRELNRKERQFERDIGGIRDFRDKLSSMEGTEGLNKIFENLENNLQSQEAKNLLKEIKDNSKELNNLNDVKEAIDNNLPKLEKDVSNQIDSLKQEVINQRKQQRREIRQVREQGIQDLMGLESERLSQYNLNPFAQREAKRLQYQAQLRSIRSRRDRELAEIADRRDELEGKSGRDAKRERKELQQRERVIRERSEFEIENVKEEMKESLNFFVQEFRRASELIVDGLKSASDQLIEGLFRGEENLGEKISRTLNQISIDYLKGSFRDIIDQTVGSLLRPANKRDISIQEASLGELSDSVRQSFSDVFGEEIRDQTSTLNTISDQIEDLIEKISEGGEGTDKLKNIEESQLNNIFDQMGLDEDSKKLFNTLQGFRQNSTENLTVTLLSGIKEETGSIRENVSEIVKNITSVSSNTGSSNTGSGKSNEIEGLSFSSDGEYTVGDEKGKVIGKIGSTGRSTGNHLDVKIAPLDEFQEEYGEDGEITAARVHNSGQPIDDLSRLNNFIEVGGKPLTNYDLNSGYGIRRNPTGRGTEHHNGYDFDTPGGAPVKLKNGATLLQNNPASSDRLGNNSVVYIPGIGIVGLNHLQEFADQAKPAGVNTISGLENLSLQKSSGNRLESLRGLKPQSNRLDRMSWDLGKWDSFLHGFRSEWDFKEIPGFSGFSSGGKVTPERLQGFQGLIRKLFGLEADYANMGSKGAMKAIASALMNLSGSLQIDSNSQGGITGNTIPSILSPDSFTQAESYSLGQEDLFGKASPGLSEYAGVGVGLLQLGNALFGSSGRKRNRPNKTKYGEELRGGMSNYSWVFDPTQQGMRSHIEKEKEEDGGGLFSTLLGIGSVLAGGAGGIGSIFSSSEGGVLSAVYPGEEFYSQDKLGEIAKKNGLPRSSGVQVAEMIRRGIVGKGGDRSKNISFADLASTKIQNFQNKDQGTVKGSSPAKADEELGIFPKGFIANTDLLKSPQWEQFTQGNLPLKSYAEGGITSPKGFDVEPQYPDISSGSVVMKGSSEMTTTSSDPSPTPDPSPMSVVRLEYESKEIAGERYVTERDFQKGVERARDEAVGKVREQFRNNPAWRRDLGVR